MRRWWLIGVLLLPGLLAAQPTGTSRITLTLHFTNNGEPLEEPTHGKFYIFEPEKREAYVAWGHDGKAARFLEGVYDLVIKYSNGQIQDEIVIEGVTLDRNVEEDIDFEIPVAHLTIDVISGGQPIVTHTGRYNLYPATKRGKPLVSKRPGERITIRPGYYDIEVQYRSPQGLRSSWVNNYSLEGEQFETVEVGETPARLRLTLLYQGQPVPAEEGRWRAYRSGRRGRPVAERASGEAADIAGGEYDIRVVYTGGDQVIERWLSRVALHGELQREIELAEGEREIETATILVRAPARRSGGSSNANLLLLIDSSAAMSERLGRDDRMRLAQRAFDDLAPELDGLPLELALRAYGIAPGASNACSDSTLLLPLSQLNGRRLADTVGLLRPAGRAPIAYSLERVGEDLPRRGRNVVVLLTGGGDNCGGDVCDAAERLIRLGLAESVHVVALGLPPEERSGLECAGSYVSVAGRAELRDVLHGILRSTAQNERGTINLFARSGGWVGGGELGQRLQVSPGTYDVIIRADGRTYSWKRVKIVGDLEAVAAPRPAFR